MVTLQAKPGRPGRARPAAEGLPPGAGRSGWALAVALLLVTGYAVFAHGAIDAPAEPRLQVATALVAAIAAAACLWMRNLRFALGRTPLVGLAALGLFALWSGVSLAWSVAPDLTWLELNRNVTYVIVLCLGVVLGSSVIRGVGLAAPGFVALVALVTLYALGQKLVPGFHLGSLLTLNHTGHIARLQEPLGYWNALALLLAMAAPLALASAIRRDRSTRVRLASLTALVLMFVTIGFTYSRGGVFVLVVGLIVCVVLTGEPLRTLMWLAAGALAAGPAIVLGLTSNALTANGVALPHRESAGALLLLLLLACLVVLWLAAERLVRAERRITVSDVTRGRFVKGLSLTGASAVAFVLIALALSARGLGGTFSHLWSSFTSTGGISVSNPARLLSADSANRWVWWKEAAGAFSSRPVLGWGAGSFPVVHLLFRQDTLTVQHPHSMPLQWLAETGIIGLVLIATAWILLLRSALVGVRRQTEAPARAMAGAVFALLVVYSVHCLFDWDWDIPGLTYPMLVLWGVLIGSARSAVLPDRRVLPLSPSRIGPALRLVAIAFSTLALCVFAAACVLPSIASSQASSALLAASHSSARSLNQAQNDAASAASLDPVSDAGPRVEAVIAEHRDDFQLARAYLLEAVRREPADARAWVSLAELDALTGQVNQAVTAGRHAFELDPLDFGLRGFALQVIHQALLSQALPGDSATRIPTP